MDPESTPIELQPITSQTIDLTDALDRTLAHQTSGDQLTIATKPSTDALKYAPSDADLASTAGGMASTSTAHLTASQPFDLTKSFARRIAHQASGDQLTITPKASEDALGIARGDADLKSSARPQPADEVEESDEVNDKPSEPPKLDWDGPSDRDNPRNWSWGKKWFCTFIVSYYTFISPLASSMLAPGLDEVAIGYNVSSPTVIGLSLSIFVLAYAIGPLFLAPLSEIYGRQWVLHIGNLFFLAFLIGCALAPNIASFLVFRFLAGLGGSAPVAVGGGVVADLFVERERATAMSIYALGPVLGPLVGPIAGGFVTQALGFRWISWLLAILAGSGSILGIPFLRETYAPALLARRQKRRDIERGIHSRPEAAVVGGNAQSRTAYMIGRMTMPLRLLCTNLVCFLLSLYMAVQYGFFYLLFTSFSQLYTNYYGWSLGVSGLAYLGPGVGFGVSILCTAAVMDRIYISLSSRNGGVGVPEYRIPMIWVGAVIGPIGLFWYGWTAQEHTHWILPIIGAAIFCASIMMTYVPIQVYLVDAFQYAASALAAASVLRSLFGFAFPLFGGQLFSALGEGGGNSLLAGIGIVCGIPFPVWLWFKGAEMRARSNGKL